MHAQLHFSRLRKLLLLLGSFLVVTATPAATLPEAAKGPVDFVKDIQPIFARHCMECHGESKQKSGFRLDVKDLVFKGGESGKSAVIPGKSAESPLIQKVAGLIEDEVMPPKGERLTVEQIGQLRAWIDAGAVWPESASKKSGKENHWAFKSPQRPHPAKTKMKSWARNPIDTFVLAGLEKEKLRPSPEADRVTLLRRLSLDLIGLPPSIEEVDAFLADKSSTAYDKQVERLLASPHYGERWGRHWLDAARYADSNGYEKDRAREAWHYRDWVIQSMNEDLPYDQFVIQQLAGDLLQDSDQNKVVATGFLRNSMFNEEGAIDPEQFRMDAMFDRMEAIGKSVLGLTIQCAQCHNHKYDPTTQEEYFRLFAFINNDDELTTPFYSSDQLKKITEVRQNIAALEKQLQENNPQWKENQTQWEQQVKHHTTEWNILEPYEYGDPGGLSKLQPQRDKSLLAGGHRFYGGTWRIKAKTTLTNITGIRMELLTNGNLPMFGPGRGGNGLFQLKEFTLEVSPVNDAAKKTKITFKQAMADHEQAQTPAGDPAKEKDKQFSGPAAFAIDGSDKTSWSIEAGPGRRNTNRKIVFLADKPFGFSEGTELVIHMSNLDEVASFRLSLTTTAEPAVDPLPKNVREALAIDPTKRSAAQAAEIFTYWRSTKHEFKETNDKIDAAWKQFPEFSATALVLSPRPEMDPRDTAVLKRGDWLKPGKKVTPGVPAFLHALPSTAPLNRLTFGQWLVDKKSPTTARVLANRMWQNYFGVGLVSTSEDFGIQVDAPSHPELLDWLACELMEPASKAPGESEIKPWSQKHLHRLIVNSATYRQSSKVTQELYTRDQYNRLLARGSRLRVEGEIVRDIALTASGLLNNKIGGASVFTPAPAFMFVPPTSYEPFPWQDAVGPDRYRRALYTFRRRSTPYPMLQVFDTPNADASCVRRLRSNTPLQALTSLNETVFVECAQALALKVLTEGGATDTDRITYAFRRTMARTPTKTEVAELQSMLQRQIKHIGNGWVDPRALATGKEDGKVEVPKGTNPTQLAAYTVLSRVLLNLDETFTKE